MLASRLFTARIIYSMNNLIDLFNSILPISKEEALLMTEHINEEVFSKGDYYLTEGKICKKLGFVTEGVFKVSALKINEEEYIKYFVTEGHFTIDLDSFFEQIPSKENIVALTESTVLSISHASYIILEKEVVNFSRIITVLKEKALLEKLTMKSEMFAEDAQTRYLKFIKRYPTVSQRVSQKNIALHLGISQYTLSRIRSQKSFIAK